MAKIFENNHKTPTVLVIPGGLNESKTYKLEANALGKRVFGASCIENDPDEDLYKNWVYVPSIYSADFEEKLQQVIIKEQITSIFCPHLLLYKAIDKFLVGRDLKVEFINPPPGELETVKVRSLYQSASKVQDLAKSLSCNNLNHLPNLEEVAGLLFYTRMIPGMTSEEKLAAFLSIFPEIPKGDIIEIGAFRGRSTYFLSWASRRYNTGKVLVIDPWNLEKAQQNNSPEILKDKDHTLMKDLNAFWETTFEGFLAALSPFVGVLNYLRLPSVDAAQIYTRDKKVQSPTFGTTSYKGQISLIHIDGNHDYEMVLQDSEAWLPSVMPGGWIVFDDYLWLHGDGPHRVGNEFLQKNQDKIDKSFCIAKSLFIKLKS